MSTISEVFTQENRLLSLDTSLGPDKLLLRSLSGREAISQLFNFKLDLLSPDSRINFEKAVGMNVTVGIRLADDTNQRYFNGYISRFAQLPNEGRLAHYEAEVVPGLWFLTRTSDCCIFQGLTVPQIVEKVFEKFGLRDYENRTQAQYDAWEYCVQYRETACNFVMRLMEQEGIFFYFKHAKGKHTLVMADSKSAHEPCPHQSKVNYQLSGGPGLTRDEDTIFQWRVEQEMRPAKYALNDFNFETPNVTLLSSVDGAFSPEAEEAGTSSSRSSSSGSPNTSSSSSNNRMKYEVYDFPGEYEKRNEGEALARLRMEEEELPLHIINGDSDCRAFTSGFRFDLNGFQLFEPERPNQNGQYVLTAVCHNMHEGSFYSGMGGGGASYTNVFTCIPASVPFRPPRVTPRPLVQGTQTAIVVGPSGEEIYTDKYGRVKVQFHWDREGRRNETSSCWIRVSQPWGGKGWGGMWIPRIGQEVIVEFLEGDPDRPLITGRVYNADQMPPYTLPYHSTRSCLKSRSSKGGNGSNFNELRFEDKKGAEQVFLHAEYDMDQRVKHDSREWVGNERHSIVKSNQKELVEGNKHAHVKGNQLEKIDGSMSLSVGQSCDEKIGMKYAVDSGQEIHLKAGMNVVIEAGVQLTIKASGGFINIGPAGVAIQGTMVLINSGGAAGAGSGSSPQNPSPPDQADDGTKGTKM